MKKDNIKTFNNLKIGNKIYFVDFNIIEEISSAYEAKVIELKKISDTIKITCKYKTNKIDEYSVLGCSTSSDWIENTMVFVSKETAISNIKSWVEEVKATLYKINKLLINIKELK